jgi:hypothetical protein
MNMGMGRNTNEVTELHMDCTSSLKPDAPPQKMAMPTIFSDMKAKATGMPLDIMTMRLPNIMSRTIGQSMVQYSLIKG